LNDPNLLQNEIQEGPSAEAVMEELANVETKVKERYEAREIDKALSKAEQGSLSEVKELA